MSKSLYFFATKTDLALGLEIIEKNFSLRYVRFGLFDSPDAEIYNSAFDISNLGYSSKGDTVQDDRFLVVNQSTTLDIKEVPQRRGGVKYEISQYNNPNSIVFCPGGLYQSDFVVAGSLTTISTDSSILGLYKSFSSKLINGFKKVKGTRYYVSPEVLELYKTRRLITINVRQSPEYDLIID